jgi:hypothetical protein
MITGMMYLTRNKKIKIKIDEDFKYVRNKLQVNKPVLINGLVYIHKNLSEDNLCDKLALKS